MEIIRQASGEGLQDDKVTLLFHDKEKSYAEELAMIMPG